MVTLFKLVLKRYSHFLLLIFTRFLAYSDYSVSVSEVPHQTTAKSDRSLFQYCQDGDVFSDFQAYCLGFENLE